MISEKKRRKHYTRNKKFNHFKIKKKKKQNLGKKTTIIYKMDLLFLSKRIYLGTDERFIHGGIIVNSEGIIQKILKSAGEVNTHLYNIESEAVSKKKTTTIQQFLIKIIKNMLILLYLHFILFFFYFI